MQEDTVAMPTGNTNQHLDSERLASFTEQSPTDLERAHLAECAACRRERDAYASLVSLAQHTAHAPTTAPRLVEWDTLATELRREGLLHAPPAVRRMPGWMRAAAAMGLVAGGAMLGRITSGDAFVGAPAARGMTNATPTVATRADLVSVAQATDVLYAAQRDYERASLYLAGHDSTTKNSDVYRARLAALDQMMTASRAALRDAPQDPVLNHYFLTAYTAREATLKQLSAALPVDKSLERY